jgi:hypothetical protein
VFLLMLSGPIVWAVHFLFVYGFTGIVCARPAILTAWLGISMAAWVISAATLLSVAAIGTIYLRMRKTLRIAGDPAFVPVLTGALGLLSVLAILWETLPVFLVPTCG